MKRVLELLERAGSTVLLATELDELVTPEVRAALAAAGVVVSEPAARYWACGGDGRGCLREVRGNYDGAKKALIAVCEHAPAECPAVELGFEDVAQVAAKVEGVVKALGAVLDIKVERGIKLRSAEPVRIGDWDGRDAYWAGRPKDQKLGDWCRARERIGEALVVVPTRKHVSHDVGAAYATGERVEIAAVDELIEVRDGALKARARRPAADAPAVQYRERERAVSGIGALLGATRWEQIRIVVVDGTTVRIEAGGQSVLRTFVELGFVDARVTETVTPVKAWSVFVLLCKNGRFRPSDYAEYGKAFSAKKAMQTLREALKGSFGMEKDPLRAYTKIGGWEPRFGVKAGGLKERD